MTIKSKIDKIPFVKLTFAILAIIFTILFLFKDRISEHKVTKAKIEMLKRMYKTPPEQWDDEFKQVFDSLIIEKVDTSEVN